MTPREAAQEALVKYLTKSPIWTAPYGVIPGSKRVGRGGYVRTIVFGIAAYLDASIYVWSPDRITVRGRGPLAYRVEGTYTSVEDCITSLEEVYR